MNKQKSTRATTITTTATTNPQRTRENLVKNETLHAQVA